METKNNLQGLFTTQETVYLVRAAMEGMPLSAMEYVAPRSAIIVLEKKLESLSSQELHTVGNILYGALGDGVYAVSIDGLADLGWPLREQADIDRDEQSLPWSRSEFLSLLENTIQSAGGARAFIGCLDGDKEIPEKVIVLNPDQTIEASKRLTVQAGRSCDWNDINAFFYRTDTYAVMDQVSLALCYSENYPFVAEVTSRPKELHRIFMTGTLNSDEVEMRNALMEKVMEYYFWEWLRSDEGWEGISFWLKSALSS